MLPADIETLVFNCFYTFLGGPGLLINFGVLFGLFWYTKFKKLREKNLLLICANLTYNGFLCSGYFVLGLLRIIQAAGGNVPYTQIQCVLLQQPIIIGCFSCDLITLMIASDRFFAVYFPLVYRSHGEHVRLSIDHEYNNT